MKVFRICPVCERPFNKEKHDFKLCPICYRFEMDLICEEILNMKDYAHLETK